MSSRRNQPKKVRRRRRKPRSSYRRGRQENHFELMGIGAEKWLWFFSTYKGV